MQGSRVGDPPVAGTVAGNDAGVDAGEDTADAVEENSAAADEAAPTNKQMGGVLRKHGLFLQAVSACFFAGAPATGTAAMPDGTATTTPDPAEPPAAAFEQAAIAARYEAMLLEPDALAPGTGEPRVTEQGKF